MREIKTQGLDSPLKLFFFYYSPKNIEKVLIG